MHDINIRIAEIVKESGLTKTEFAKKINVSQQHVSRLAQDGNPSDRTISDICREFHINEIWLRIGEGKMKEELPRDEQIAKILGSAIAGNLTARDRLIRALARLPDDAFPMIEKIILDAAESIKNEKSE